MSPRLALVAVVATLHLFLVLCGAARMRLMPDDDLAGKALHAYGGMSGSSNNYFFFAPSVSPALLATFDLTDDSGRAWSESLGAGRNREVAQRIRTSLVYFQQFPEIREDLAAHWAETMFERYPDARQVVVRVEIHDVPTMADYQAGARPPPSTLYQASFVRQAPGSSRAVRSKAP
jgi:hypothetical protein